MLRRIWKKYKLELALIAWTFFAWSNRAKNILDEQTIQIGELSIAFGFLLLAASSLVVLWVKNKTVDMLSVWFLSALSVLGIARWLYRTPVVLLGSESAAFKLVHTLLALVTIVLSVFVLRRQKPWKRGHL